MIELQRKFSITPNALKIAKKSDVMHLLQKGILFFAFYDLETTGLSKEYGQPTEFGGVITDLAGNPMHVSQLHAKPSDFNVFDPYAWVVTRMHEQNLQKGLSQYFLAGHVMQFFHHASHLDEAPFRNDFLKICKKGKYTNPDGTTESFYAYPLQNDDGTIDWDSVRIHENCKKFYVKDPSSNEWHKHNICATSIGYNNVTADDQWIWSLLHMACAETIFHTHVKELGKYRLDMLRVVEAAVTIGEKGEQGVKPGVKVNPETMAELHSFTQGSVIEANSRIGSELRGILEGIKNPDGSYVNMDQLHGALKDALALAGLTQFIRRQSPKILRQMEMNMDWQDVVARLAEKQSGFGDHPVMAYVDKDYPYVTGKMITLIGTDQYRNQPKLALVWDLSHDPNSYHFKGKPLKDLSPQEHAKLIDMGVYKVIRTHRCPRLFPAEMGFTAGFNNGVEMPELHKRAKALRDQGIIENAMAGLRLAYPKLEGPQTLLYPQPEEERFTFSTLEKRDLDLGQTVQIMPIKNTLDMLAQDARSKAMMVKKLLLRAIEPREDILVNDFTDQPEAESKAAKKFVDKIEDVNKEIKKKNGIQLPQPAKPVYDRKTAYIYKMQLLHFVRNQFTAGKVKDIGHHYWFEDRYGHRMPDEDLKSWDQKKIDSARAAGDLQVAHEETNVTAEIIDRIFDGEGLSAMLGPAIQQHLKDVKALRRHGIPALNRQDRWYTLSQAEQDMVRILNNWMSDDDRKAIEKRYPGMWEKYFQTHHDAQASLGAYMRYLNDQKERFPQLSVAQMTRLKIDPVSGAPMERVRYPIDPNGMLLVPVPDRYLENPVVEPVSGKPVWMLGISRKFNKHSVETAIRDGHSIVLQAQSTGKRVHLPRALVLATKPQEGGVQDEFYKQVKVRYAESHREFPKPRLLVALTGEWVEPVHELHPPQFDHQTLKISKRLFEGLCDPSIAGYAKKPKGVLIYDDSLDVYESRVRILETHEDNRQPTGWEFSTAITGIRRVSVKQLGRLSDEQAAAYGYTNTNDLVSAASKMFSGYKLSPKDPKNKVWLIDFGKIEPFHPEYGTRYFNPTVRKISAYRRDSEALPKMEVGV